MKFVPPLLLLALIVATVLFKNYADAQRVELLRHNATDVAALRTEIRTLQREFRDAEASTPEHAPNLSPQAILALNRLGDLTQLIDVSLASPSNQSGIIPFLISARFGQTVNPAMATLFALNSEQMATLDRAYQTAYSEIRRLAVEDGQNPRAKGEIVPNAAMQLEHQKMRAIFKQTLGAERYSFYETLGCTHDDLRYLFKLQL